MRSRTLITLQKYGRTQDEYKVFEDGTMLKHKRFGQHPDLDGASILEGIEFMESLPIDQVKAKLEALGAIVWVDRLAYLDREHDAIQEIAQSLYEYEDEQWDDGDEDRALLLMEG